MSRLGRENIMLKCVVPVYDEKKYDSALCKKYGGTSIAGFRGKPFNIRQSSLLNGKGKRMK